MAAPPTRLSVRAIFIALALLSSAIVPAASSAQAGASPPDLAQYTGEYHWIPEPSIATAVTLDHGTLYHRREGFPPHALLPDPGPTHTQDRFAVPAEGSHVIFERDAGGAITGCRFLADSDGHVKVEEKRTSDRPPHLLPYREYTRTEATIPMRDGVNLHAVILRPRDTDPTAAALPFLLERTPYGVDDNDSEQLNYLEPELASSGYIFVYEDVRGRYRSDGTFVMVRPLVPHRTPADVDESTDAHDTVDWLLKNVPGNNGRVGVWGISYPGFLAMMAGIDPHPAVKAISPQAPMTDVWLGDDFFHNGAFRQSYAFDYTHEMEGGKTRTIVESREDAFDFFLHQGNFANAAASAKISSLPSVRAFLEQPAYTPFWRDKAVQSHLDSAGVPTLLVGGFWDQEDMWGTQAEYAALTSHDTDHHVFLVLGPWNHGGWLEPARRLGPINFGQATGIEFRKDFEAPFFEHFLKDRTTKGRTAPDTPTFDLAGAATFRTGVNHWERYPAWPPPQGVHPASLFLEPGGRLTFDAPTSAETIAASYTSDPASPIPYRHRPIQSTYAPGTHWYTWLVEDQRFVSGRKDLANFSTPALDHDVTVTGEVAADLFAATSGSDTDLVVKLIDVYPDDAPGKMAGFELMVSSEIFRGRYLHSFERPETLEPGKVNEFRWSLHAADHTFLKGHRIMVEVQSTWFPLYDRNPQTYVPNIMTAPAKAYKPATITIYSSPQFPSHLDLPLAQ